MAMANHPTPPPLTGDDITHFRHVLRGGPDNEREKITVEVASLVDDGEATPPYMSVHGELDMSTDQATELVDAIQRAQVAYRAALESWKQGL